MESEKFMIRLASGQSFGPADMALLEQWAREGRVPRDAQLVPANGAPACSVLEMRALAAIVMAPPTVSSGLQKPFVDVPGPALIPYKNPPALIGYYLSVFALMPFIGFALTLPAVGLGIAGLVKRSKNPNVRGAAHAWVAIILGVLGPMTTTWLTVLLLRALEDM